MHEPDGITRRASLLRFGGVLVAGAGISACGAGSSKTTAVTGPADVASGRVRCVLAPEQTQGPYYIAGEKVRRDIREGHPGAALALRLAVVDASTCKPIRGTAVDVWHCDAAGDYSAFSNGGAGSRTFLRGTQPTGPHGIATFQTIYPGWYPGRTPHIHVKVHLGGNVVHTGQLYFPDDLTDAVYKASPYSGRGARDTRNASDFVYRAGGSTSMLRVRRHGSGYVGSITMGVRRS